MKRLVNFTAAVLAASALAVSLASTPRTANALTAAAVQVVNTPLPVTGNVNAAVTGDVNATIAGPVNLAAGTTVNIGNSTADPVLVRDVGSSRQPVHGFNGCFFSGAYCLIDLITVPAGQRLVIEHISGNIQTGLNEQVFNAQIGRAFQSCCIVSADDYLVTHLVDGTPISQVNHQTLMFFNAGDTVRVYVTRSQNGNQGGVANFSYAGYLMPN